ncbi:hypothetical protein NQ318_010558 [Aromia moschata]|uniref:Reverse transcriptase domain-containing protein n=1 Tax=Aromia moschata TaxID=1265417 RepID=A0AAV8X7H8_9CUCU|nr:hypothetical protein NQ318_010558 [Aromia moschata]
MEVGNWRLNQVTLQDLLFADYMVLLAEIEKQLQQNLNIYQMELWKINMEINIEKTKTIHGDRTRTQAEVFRLFQEKYPELPPISQGTAFLDSPHIENKMYPYKLVPTNELAEDDFDRRILFCEQMMQMLDDNTLQIENVVFSNEPTFTLHGHVNLQNCRYKNSHWMKNYTRKTLRKLMFGQE